MSADKVSTQNNRIKSISDKVKDIFNGVLDIGRKTRELFKQYYEPDYDSVSDLIVERDRILGSNRKSIPATSVTKEEINILFNEGETTVVSGNSTSTSSAGGDSVVSYAYNGQGGINAKNDSIFSDDPVEEIFTKVVTEAIENKDEFEDVRNEELSEIVSGIEQHDIIMEQMKIDHPVYDPAVEIPTEIPEAQGTIQTKLDTHVEVIDEPDEIDVISFETETDVKKEEDMDALFDQEEMLDKSVSAAVDEAQIEVIEETQLSEEIPIDTEIPLEDSIFDEGYGIEPIVSTDEILDEEMSVNEEIDEIPVDVATSEIESEISEDVGEGTEEDLFLEERDVDVESELEEEILVENAEISLDTENISESEEILEEGELLLDSDEIVVDTEIVDEGEEIVAEETIEEQLEPEMVEAEFTEEGEMLIENDEILVNSEDIETKPATEEQEIDDDLFLEEQTADIESELEEEIVAENGEYTIDTEIVEAEEIVANEIIEEQSEPEMVEAEENISIDEDVDEIIFYNEETQDVDTFEEEIEQEETVETIPEIESITASDSEENIDVPDVEEPYVEEENGEVSLPESNIEETEELVSSTVVEDFSSSNFVSPPSQQYEVASYTSNVDATTEVSSGKVSFMFSGTSNTETEGKTFSFVFGKKQ